MTVSKGRREASDASDGPEPAGLYVHVPFCRRACPYCDFDFEVGRTPDQGRWLRGLGDEWGARAAHWAAHRFDTLYLGGGTPSLLGAAGLRAVAGFLERSLGPRLGRAERTCELNPEDIDDSLVEALGSLDVRRVSLGVQTFHPEGLSQLGRMHDAAQAHAAVELLQNAGIEVSLDLIVGWPGQDIRVLEQDLTEALSHDPPHLSVYALTVEEGSNWPKLVTRGLRVLPDDDGQAALLVHAERKLVGRGYIHYEISSYARPGRVARHNAKYWRGVDYLGLGPSAGSMRSRPGLVIRRVNRRGLGSWLEAPERAEEQEELDGEAAAVDSLFMGLRRLDEGVALERLALHGVDSAWLEARIARQLELGNLQFDGETVRVSPERWLFHRAIAYDLV